jgi:hypothetical protein
MATNAALKELLELAATNFGKRDQWVEDCLTLWLAIPAIHDASDAQMKAAMLHYLSTGKYAPRVADMVEALAMARPRVGPAPGAKADCADCGDTGWREGIAHFQEADGVRIEGPVALVCGCRSQRGVPYQDWLRQQEQRPGFIGHFHTGKQYPQIPDDWRLTPQQIARVAQLKAAKARPKGQVIAFNPQAVDHHARDRARLAKQAARMWNETEEEAV